MAVYFYSFSLWLTSSVGMKVCLPHLLLAIRLLYALLYVLASACYAHIYVCFSPGSVLLRDVQALTLYKGRYTSARRSSPVPQLQCIGGSAGCTAFVPEVVQCQNRGWDGVDVQVNQNTNNQHLEKFIVIHTAYSITYRSLHYLGDHIPYIQLDVLLCHVSRCLDSTQYTDERCYIRMMSPMFP